MTDEDRFMAVRQLRVEADRLRIVCIEATKTSALLHVAYDQNNPAVLPIDQTVLVGALRGIR